MSGRKTFYLDKRNGKLLGVCAGIADYLRLDATFIRVGLVIVTLVGAFPWTLLAYGLAGWLAKVKPADRFEADEHPAYRPSTRDLREEMSSLDRRLAEVDSHVAGSNSRLAREIEELR